MTTLIALQNFSPDGSRRIREGETFTVTDNTAKLLIATKRAKPMEDRKQREYKRRDMRAES